MFYIISIKGSLYGITDTEDNTEKFYSCSELHKVAETLKHLNSLSHDIVFHTI